MRQVILLIFVFAFKLCFANMASPIQEGTYSGTAFSSRDVDIVKETIFIKIDKEFKTAYFFVEYFINTETDGKQIPLLFHARDYKGDFKIRVDNQEVNLLDIPGEYTNTAHSPFEKFSDYFSKPFREGESETVEIQWEKNTSNVYKLNDLKYFETDLIKGEHRIRIEYTANVWSDISKWVKEYSFRYSLSPAKNWKSFGELQITIDATSFQNTITTNLGPQTKGRLDSLAVWNFSNLPSDYIEIIYIPEISGLAKTLISINPTGLTIIFSILIILLHLTGIIKHRKNHPTKKYSWVVIAGSIIVPFLMLISHTISYSIIDNVIGKEAGNYHGYHFLIIVFYPILFPVYLAIMWCVDAMFKQRKSNKP